MPGSTQRLRIASEADATHSLMAASRFARQLGFGPQDCQAISTAVSELARNILKYAHTGEILIERVQAGANTGIEVTARDRGPGIEDVEAAMSDHYSSSGTLGLGLPGVKRLMDDFQIDSQPGVGTRVVVRKWHERSPKRTRSVLLDATRRASLARREGPGKEGSLEIDTPSTVGTDCAFFVRPCRGERVSGDAAVLRTSDDHVFLAVVDALGHGPAASRIATQASAFLKGNWSLEPAATMEGLHDVMRGTDGAAAGLCVVELSSGSARFAGVGNTVARILGKREKTVFSTPGTLGHQIRTQKEQRLMIEPGDLLLLYSDGIRERFELDDYPRLRLKDARTIARTIVSRFGKDYDDASCVVMRYGS